MATVTANLWPYAIRMASEAVNNTPSFQDPNKRTPIEMFSGARAASNPKHWKPFGSPTYVLENDLQGQKPFHKRRQRSKQGINLGVSPVHDRKVALVLNRDTGLASPQFHVAFDPRFDTVKEITTESKWQIREGFVIQRELYEKRARNSNGEEEPRDNNAPSQSRRKRKRSEATTEQQQETMESHEPSTHPAAANVCDGGHPMPPNDSGTQREAESVFTTTRSGRKARAAPRLSIEAMTSETARATAGDVEGEIYCYATMSPNDDAINHVDPLRAYKALPDLDTLYYHQAMKESDSEEFRDSTDKEINDQFENGNITVVHTSQVPEKLTILAVVWQMRRKRDAKTAAIKKRKAHLNIDGLRMRKGEHYDMTYSPVTSWNSVRMLLTLTALHGWTTKQIDFVQAFAQAPIEKTLCMKIPAGNEIADGSDPRDYVLEIHRNIYGQKQAGRVWNRYLMGKLVGELDFRQSAGDECVFYRRRMLYVLYTDDSLLAGPDAKEIDTIIDELQQKAKLAITVEGDVADFLGVNIDRRNLIKQILKDLRLDGDSVKPQSTPAASSELLS